MYPSDLTDTEWGLLKPLFPSPSPRGRPRLWALRHILNAIFSMLRAGCAWRFLPQDDPPWPTVCHDFRRWQQTGLWQLLHDAVRRAVRTKAPRAPLPSAPLMESQSVKTTVEPGTLKGYDGHTRVKGRKRHVLVDPLGLRLSVYVTPANPSERTGAPCLPAGLQPLQPRLVLIRAEGPTVGKTSPRGMLRREAGGLRVPRAPRTSTAVSSCPGGGLWNARSRGSIGVGG
jgi:putative transposase